MEITWNHDVSLVIFQLDFDFINKMIDDRIDKQLAEIKQEEQIKLDLSDFSFSEQKQMLRKLLADYESV